MFQARVPLLFNPLISITMENEIKVGTILYGTWGYTMTIPCFYKVTKVTPTGCKVVALEKYMSRSGDGGYNQMGWELPKVNVVRSNSEQLARFIPRLGEFKVGSSADHTARYLSIWDGREVWANYCD